MKHIKIEDQASYREGTRRMYRENNYIIDIHRSSETKRLIAQDSFTTDAMGGVFPPDISVVGKRILDIACGPGGWARRVAFEYPDAQVVGADINPTMIEYASQLAEVAQLKNVQFQVMDASSHLTFDDEMFDLVNCRFLIGFLTPQIAMTLFQEVFRILRPGGNLRWTEAELGFSSSAAYELYMRHLSHAFFQSGRSFSSDGFTMGLTPRMLPFLREQGFLTLRKEAYVIEGSYGFPMHTLGYQDMELLIAGLHPFLVSIGAASETELQHLENRVLEDYQAQDYYALNFYLSAWGHKPEKD